MSATPKLGRLVLMPNTLDLGADPVPLPELLPAAVISQAAQIQHWVAEDARCARAFLKRIGALVPLSVPLQQMHIVELPKPRKGSQETITTAQWAAMLTPALAGHDLGLISDAGMPAVADPGAALVAAAHAAGVPVAPLPGPSSLLLALAASGLNGQSFAFVGYLPQDSAARAARIKELEATSRRQLQTQICIETPYRNQALLSALLQALAPNTTLSISLGLTLPEGWSRSQRVAQWRAAPPALSDKVPAVFLWLAA